MWLTVESIEYDTIYGRLDNDPVHLKKVRVGSRLHIHSEELHEWLYTEGKALRGGFTRAAIKKAAQRCKQK
jgi:uncharacterized protein YegJ (DUF2314 family)